MTDKESGFWSGFVYAIELRLPTRFLHKTRSELTMTALVEVFENIFCISATLQDIFADFLQGLAYETPTCATQPKKTLFRQTDKSRELGEHVFSDGSPY